ncbi:MULTISPECIES: hypothetical protein [unclassified Arenibacter]|uniref:hypothetical protein n=1 Tax=unclassified Arenibacter TaxID=2615047 RepID=UPI002044CBB1|nr:MULTISPECIES: hypothetical protein [unclassified Arenibacter]
MITDDFKKPKEPFFATTQTNNSYLCVFNAMARIFHIVFLTALGFFLTPTLSYACDSKSEKIETICNKQSDSEIQKKDCCNEEKGQCGKHENQCDGKCGNPTCQCPSHCPNFSTPFLAQFSLGKMILSKPNFYYQDTYYSSGFLSIWQPPKIG